MLHIVTETAATGRRRLVLVVMVICTLVLASPPWCALQTDHHAGHSGSPTAVEPVVGEPSDDAASHCSSTRPADTAIRAQAPDAPGPMVTGSTPPTWHAATLMRPADARASAVPLASHALIRTCQLRI